MTPPRVAEWLLGCFLPGSNREEILGDLEEEFSLHCPRSASRWYWGQAFRSIPAVVRSHARRERWLRMFGVALAAYICANVLEYTASEAVAHYFGAVQQTTSAIIGLTTLFAAGYSASRFHSGANLAVGALAAAVVTALIAVDSGHMPLWYQLAFLIGGPSLSIAGGAFPIRRRR
jgi:hypothetical protein